MSDFLRGLGTAKTAPVKLEGVIGILDAFSKQLVIDLRKSIDDKTEYSTQLGAGLLPKKIIVETTSFGDKLTYELELPAYWKYVDEGRGPSKKDEGGKVRKALMGIPGWIARKPLKLAMTYSYKRKLKDGKEKTYTYKYKNSIAAAKAAAFLIARKIHRFGSKGNNFYSEVVTDSLLNSLRKDLVRATKKDIAIHITTT